MSPVKINMVVRRGINESSVVPMAAWARERGVILRFIEYMDVGHSNGWRLDEVVPAAELVETIGAVWPIEAAEPAYRGEVAGRWRYLDGGGEIGIISSVTQPFCRDCTRARISAEGKLYTCLFAAEGHDLRAVVRSDASDAELSAVIERIWLARGDRYSELRSAATSTLPEDRDVRDGRLSARHRDLHRLSTVVDKSWMGDEGHSRSWWITALTPPTAGPYRRSCPKGPTGSKDPRLHQGPLFRRRSLRALRCHGGWSSHHDRPVWASPTGRDRHPGVDTSVGPTKSASTVEPPIR